MLDLSSVDLEMVGVALEDHSYESSWWFNPENGETEFCGAGRQF